MLSKQNPFSLYDFLGYFTPGAITLYSAWVVVAHGWAKSCYATNGIILGLPPNTLQFDNPELYVPFVLAAYLTGHVLNFLSSKVVEQYSIWTLGYPSKYLLGNNPRLYFELGEKEPKFLGILVRLVYAVLLAPIALVDVVFNRSGARLLIRKPLDDFLSQSIQVKSKQLINSRCGLQPDVVAEFTMNTDFFRFLYHYCVENCEHHYPKFQNYVALYGFTRTMAFAAAMFWWVILVHVIVTWFSLPLMLYLIICTVIAAILYLAFAKFYRRFSLEVMMAVAVSAVPPPHPSSKVC